MKELIHSYIDIEFIKEFIKMKPSYDIEADNLAIEIWRDFFKFLKDKTSITLDIDKIKVDELSYDLSLIRYFVDLYNQNDKHITINSEFSKLTTKQLIDKKPNCNFIFHNKVNNNTIDCDKLGLVIVNSSNLFEIWKHFYNSKTLNVAKNSSNFSNWSDLKKYSFASNSIVIADNYILHNKKHIYNNLFKILENLIPNKQLKIEIDIMIISSEFYDSKMSNVYDFIYDFIHKQLHLSKFNLCLVKKHSYEFHDRHIYTNYFIYKSGHSFNYFDYKNNTIISSTLDIHPLNVYSNNDNTFALLSDTKLKELKTIVNSSQDYCGNKNNKLINKA